MLNALNHYYRDVMPGAFFSIEPRYEPKYDLRILLNIVFQGNTTNQAEMAGEMKSLWHASTTLFCPLSLLMTFA